MHRYFPLFLGRGRLLTSTDALAQNRVAAEQPAVNAATSQEAPLLYRVPAEAVRVVSSAEYDARRAQSNPVFDNRGGTEDSVSYYDEATYYVILDEFDELATPANEIIEASLRFSPGYGDELPPDTDTAVDGQVSTIGLVTNNPVVPTDNGAPSFFQTTGSQA